MASRITTVGTATASLPSPRRMDVHRRNGCCHRRQTLQAHQPISRSGDAAHGGGLVDAERRGSVAGRRPGRACQRRPYKDALRTAANAPASPETPSMSPFGYSAKRCMKASDTINKPDSTTAARMGTATGITATPIQTPNTTKYPKYWYALSTSDIINGSRW